MYIIWKPDYSPKLSFIFIISLKFQTSEWTWKKPQISFFSLFWRRQTACCLRFCGLVTLQTDKYSFVNDKCRSCSRGVCWTMVWAEYWKVQQFLIEPFARVTCQISMRVSQLCLLDHLTLRDEQKPKPWPFISKKKKCLCLKNKTNKHHLLTVWRLYDQLRPRHTWSNFSTMYI